MMYFIALENKKTPPKVDLENPDIAPEAVELELVLVTTTDDQELPANRFEVMKEYDEIPEQWDRFFPEILPGKQKGAVKRTGVFFGFSGTETDRTVVMEYVNGLLNARL